MLAKSLMLLSFLHNLAFKHCEKNILHSCFFRALIEFLTQLSINIVKRIEEYFFIPIFFRALCECLKNYYDYIMIRQY